MRVLWKDIDNLCNSLGIRCTEYDYYYEAFGNYLDWPLESQTILGQLSVSLAALFLIHRFICAKNYLSLFSRYCFWW
jgi:hypothetical protein